MARVRLLSSRPYASERFEPPISLLSPVRPDFPIKPLGFTCCAHNLLCSQRKAAVQDVAADRQKFVKFFPKSAAKLLTLYMALNRLLRLRELLQTLRVDLVRRFGPNPRLLVSVVISRVS